MSEPNTWERAAENARARVHDDPEVVESACRWVMENFGGCHHRAAEFFLELARWR